MILLPQPETSRDKNGSDRKVIFLTNSQEKYIRQLNNFRWNRDSCEKIIEGNSEFFEAADFFEQFILASRYSADMRLPKEDKDDKQLLKNVLSKIYGFIYDNMGATYDPLHITFAQKSLNKTVEKSCTFTTLCTFLHTSTRIKGKSFPDFIYKHDPVRHYASGSYSKTQLEFEAERLRKSRYRKLRQGRVYVPEYKWAAVSTDLEHELSFRFVIDQCDSNLVDTYKRFGNLYNDILKTIDGEKGDDYAEDLLNAGKRFLAKVRKIDYSKYLRLQRQIIAHLKSDEKYIGINLYRLERTMMPWRMINDVNFLLSNQCDRKTETAFLQKTAYLKEIPFPKIYCALRSLTESAENIRLYADLFDEFIYYSNIVGCLILDTLIEENFLGNNWADTMRCIMNDLAVNVLYDPEELKLDTPEENAQEKFEALLSYPVELDICNRLRYLDGI